jgi:hypothetical protein
MTNSSSSEKRAAANRENAKKSTGPRTEAGKAASRRNAMTHGLTATRILPLDAPGEAPGAYEARLEFWFDDLQPRNVLEAAMIECACRSSWKLDRCARFESAAANARQARRFRAVNGPELAAKVEEARVIGVFLRLEYDFPAPPNPPEHEGIPNPFDDPPEFVARLCAFKEGVEWLLNEWDQTLPQLPAADDPVPEFADEDEARAYAHRIDRKEIWGCRLLGIPTKGPRPSLPVREAGRAEVRRLEKLHATLSAEVPTQIDTDLTLFDAGPEAQLLMRYEAEASRSLHRSVNALMKLRKDAEHFPQATPEAESAAESESVLPESASASSRGTSTPARREMPSARNEATADERMDPDRTSSEARPGAPAPPKWGR